LFREPITHIIGRIAHALLHILPGVGSGPLKTAHFGIHTRHMGGGLGEPLAYSTTTRRTALRSPSTSHSST
jgi:hypothetical protein